MSESRRAAAIPAVFFGFIALACSAPDMRDFTKEKPAAADVVGIWRIEPDSAAGLRSRRGVEADGSAIELRADGTFQWTDAPEFLIDRGSPEEMPGVATWEGTWETGTALWLETPNERRSPRSWAHLFGSKPPYTLGFERAEGETYIFTRDGDVHPFPTALVPK